MIRSAAPLNLATLALSASATSERLFAVTLMVLDGSEAGVGFFLDGFGLLAQELHEMAPEIEGVVSAGREAITFPRLRIGPSHRFIVTFPPPAARAQTIDLLPERAFIGFRDGAEFGRHGTREPALASATSGRDLFASAALPPLPGLRAD